MMKAKVKATGEIVNVYFRSPLWYNGDTEETYFPKELDTVWVEKREKRKAIKDHRLLDKVRTSVRRNGDAGDIE